MELTTGAILRRISEMPLHGGPQARDYHHRWDRLEGRLQWARSRDCPFTLAHLAEKMGVSRQHLTALLLELAASRLALVRWKPNGKFAPWLFQDADDLLFCEPAALHVRLLRWRTD
jgi:hypothetical protein